MFDVSMYSMCNIYIYIHQHHICIILSCDNLPEMFKGSRLGAAGGVATSLLSPKCLLMFHARKEARVSETVTPAGCYVNEKIMTRGI